MKRDKRGRGRKSSPKQTLNLPHHDHAKSAVLNSLPSVSARQTRRRKALATRALAGCGKSSLREGSQVYFRVLNLSFCPPEPT
jgi:hypothetical protein